MEKKFNLDNFTKLELFQAKGGANSVRCVSINRKGYSIRISSLLAKELEGSIVANDRVDVYANGSVLAIVKSPVGCLHVRAASGGAKSLCIGSQSAYLALARARPASFKNETRFKAWVEDGVLLVDMAQPVDRKPDEEGDELECPA